MMTEIRNELLFLIAESEADRWIPFEMALHQLAHYEERLIPGLADCLVDVDSAVRYLAIQLLDEVGQRTKPALPNLIQALLDEHRGVRAWAASCVAKFGPEAVDAISLLLPWLEDETEPYFQIVAANAIGKIAPENPLAVSVLIASLDDSNPFNRSTACEFLGERRHKSGVLCTIKLLNDADSSVRLSASTAIGLTFGNWMHAVGICLELLKDEDEMNRCVGGESLLSIKRYIQNDLDVVSMAISTAPSWEARIHIEEVLDQLRSP